MNDRIEHKRFEKYAQFYKWGAIIMALLAILRIALEPDILNGGAKTIDFMMFLFPIGFYFQFRKVSKKWGGQFIEWNDHQVSFKSRDYDNTTIEYTQINSIEIKLDTIIINTANTVYKLNIEDYTEYEDRMRLKSNFKRVEEILKVDEEKDF